MAAAHRSETRISTDGPRPRIRAAGPPLDDAWAIKPAERQALYLKGLGYGYHEIMDLSLVTDVIDDAQGGPPRGR
jgi:hypothetical protein